MTAVSNRCDCYKEEKCDVTLLPHRSKISGSLDRDGHFHCRKMGERIRYRFVSEYNLAQSSAIFAGRSVEIKKFCYLSNVT